MQAIRLLLAQRHLALLICGAALVLKLLVPTGYMIQADHGRLAIIECSGVVQRPAPVAAAAATHGDMAEHASMHDHAKADHHDQSGDHSWAKMPCAFAGLSAAALGAIDPIQLAALIAFVLAIGFVPVVLPTPARDGYLRPPLRGPPAYL
ncbi:hypothetical protein [Sphingomonas sp. IC4-52]|uniref:hypothetical protein n=1 Tax=Sphingomonas sp. IC4-52 TaxID=2887202 RepID=UPI001D118578|nr:hypothetical protein [Sphingomonas sp. IC4-52]MCC2981179.1 hypothetical protein [Sphingomonas sp. IC4-52]